MRGSTALYGHAQAVGCLAWTGYTQDGNYQHDLAVIYLDRPIGAITGWRGYGYNNSCDFYTSGAWIHNTYPHEGNLDGWQMYQRAGFLTPVWVILSHLPLPTT